MNDEDWIRELANVNREQQEEEEGRLDERWDRLSGGELSPEEEAELRALAATSEEAREAWEAFRPLGSEFQASVVKTVVDKAIQDEVRSALAGDEPALTRLVRKLTPVIQSRVARGLLLWRTGAAAGRNVRQEVEDITQDIFLYLFADGGKVLRSWQRERGLSLVNFVGLVATRQTASIVRNGKRSPWNKEDPTLFEDFNQAGPERGLEEIIASREQCKLLLDRLTEKLSPMGWHLFDLLFLRELPLKEVIRQTGMSPAAVYAWRSRLRRQVRWLLDEMS